MRSYDKYGFAIIDEAHVRECCNRLEGILDGRTDRRECQAILFELDQSYSFAREKTSQLQRLFKQERIRDLAEWRYDVLCNIQAIENLAAISKQLVERRIEELKRFRVELRPPLDWHRAPLMFWASVYVDDRFHGSLSCVVTDAELSLLPIGPKSFSKRRARLRRISDYYRAFEAGFPRHIERSWEKGVDLVEAGHLSWTEVTRAR